MTVPEYVPIMKAKKGEFDALNPIRLEQLEYKIQPVFHPLFEMPNVYEEGASRLADVTKRCEKIASLWNGNIALVDGYELLKKNAALLESQEEPDIDNLMKIVEESMIAYKACKSRVDAVQQALNETFKEN